MESFSEKIYEYIRMDNLNYENENIERKYFKNMQKSKFLKLKNILLELEKKIVELKRREVKVKREIEELFFKPIMISIIDMNKSEQNEMKKIRPIKNAWYDWLIDYELSL